MKVDIFGSTSKISIGLFDALSKNGISVNLISSRDVDFANIELTSLTRPISLESDYYVFCSGLLHPKRINQQTSREIELSININLISIVRICEYILNYNEKGKIIIIGSESGKKGSFDTTYFLSKAALKKYVEERKLTFQNQQLLMVSPSTISDSGMTERRSDIDNLNCRMQALPKKRFLYSDELVKLISFIITNEMDYLSNTELEVNGGKFARMEY
ncbi:SDR family NAD(P)-dependent oxidoreductase [Vibrio splendidus]